MKLLSISIFFLPFFILADTSNLEMSVQEIDDLLTSLQANIRLKTYLIGVQSRELKGYRVQFKRLEHRLHNLNSEMEELKQHDAKHNLELTRSRLRINRLHGKLQTIRDDLKLYSLWIPGSIQILNGQRRGIWYRYALITVLVLGTISVNKRMTCKGDTKKPLTTAQSAS